MLNPFSRTERLLGKEAMEKLAASRVAVFGIGGVGGYTAEALVRSGIGAIDLIDSDRICMSNINRQIYATRKTVGQYKVDAAAARIAEISPETVVRTHKIFYMPESAGKLDLAQYDYIVDAIDTVTGKIALAVNAEKAGVPIISAMGAGNKLDPTKLEVADLYETSVCPLAKVMRYELRRRGVKKLKVVYSREVPVVPAAGNGEEESDGETSAPEPGAEPETPATEPGTARRRQVPGSNAFVPPVAGLILAGEVVKDLIRRGPEDGRKEI